MAHFATPPAKRRRWWRLAAFLVLVVLALLWGLTMLGPRFLMSNKTFAPPLSSADLSTSTALPAKAYPQTDGDRFQQERREKDQEMLVDAPIASKTETAAKPAAPPPPPPGTHQRQVGAGLATTPPLNQEAAEEQVQEQVQVNRLQALSQIANLPTPASLTQMTQTTEGVGKAKKADLALTSNAPERALSGRHLSPEQPLGGTVPLVPANNVERDTLETMQDALVADDKSRWSLSENFLHTRYDTQNLHFQAAEGYWANTYVPGDPLLRRLQVRLKRQHPSLPDRNVQSIWQPFDAPQQAALALYVQADKRTVQGSTRLLLQVGLKGTARHSGRRPAMRVGIVLDLRGTLSSEQGTLMRALLQALLQARQSDDQFLLAVAGRPGGLLLPPEQFRQGPLSLALPHLFGDAPAPSAEQLELPQAIEAAAEHLKRNDSPDSPLGTSLLLLVTAQSLGTAAETLNEQAHQYATAGIPLSVVGIGNQLAAAELEELTVLGQGHLRLLERNDAAAALIDRELHAVSRVVARALRLNIRLSPSVKLIDIPGSHRLDTHRSTQMRQAERSIDQRLARSLGIERDRGTDEAGIQILLPAFYANDSHVILLDLVAEKPGQLAEISLRYKDLVYSRNGIARASLNLGNEATTPGPLELNVWKNLLALQLAQGFKQAGEQLAAAQVQHAVESLQNYLQVLEEMQTQVTQWRQDQELQQDQQLVQHYIQLLAHPETISLTHLADSLQYAAFIKTLQPPD